MDPVGNSLTGTIPGSKLGVTEEQTGCKKNGTLPTLGIVHPTLEKEAPTPGLVLPIPPPTLGIPTPCAELPMPSTVLNIIDTAPPSPGIDLSTQGTALPTLATEPHDPGSAPSAQGALTGRQDPPQELDPESHCPEHGLPRSRWCQEERRSVCVQCPCQQHHTQDLEESACRIRNKIVDQCEILQLKTSGIEKYMAEVLPGKNRNVTGAAICAREQIIQRLMFVRNVCENEEQRLLEQVHVEEERAQQGILTQRAHWEQSAQKLVTLRTYLVDVLTKMDDCSLMLSQAEIFERTEEAEGILEPKESEKLNFNGRCAQSFLLNGLWASAVMCCTTGMEDIVIDEKTISPLLIMSEDKRNLTFVSKKPVKYQDCPERFTSWPNSFATKSFQTGIHAWRIGVEKSAAYKIGIAYGSIERKGPSNDSRFGFNPASWVFSRYDKDFRFSHDSQHQTVELLKSPKQIGVLVDCDGGEVLFYDPDSCVVLHSHHERFTAPVFPVFAVADKSITIL